ncbi:hypothetical protein RHMOL_Rhmol08G0238700 [Rhododendron molle]|uniref:Uncharacterized protein n=1 Tax=Rhododendron molle TaxID=49168 RepID=A0ACC0MRP7_RHOML|nr:hypothetical protein RHMOL_Rhmol08G0238700 [Rhododendron molle]
MLSLASKRLLGLGLRGTQTPAAAQLLPQIYHERIVDHYNHQRNVGSFLKSDPTFGTGLLGAPACGDVMKLQIKTGKIVDACFKTFGCGSAMAYSSAATEWVKAKQMEEVLTIKNTEIAKHLSPPVKRHCSTLAGDATKAANSMNTLRPLSPHLPIYQPQLSSTFSIFHRITGIFLTTIILVFYQLCLKMGLVCFTYETFYQFLFFSSKLILISVEITALALAYHIFHGVRHLWTDFSGFLFLGRKRFK